MANSIYRLVDFIGNKFNLLILSPSYRSFGDSVEQIFFSLLHCQAKKKKLILIKPFRSIFFKKVSISNIYLYQLEHELIYKVPIFVEIFFSCLMSFLAGLSFLNITGRKTLTRFFNLPKNFYRNIDLSYAATQHFGKAYVYSFSDKEIHDPCYLKELEKEYVCPNLPNNLIKKSEEFINLYAPESLNKEWIILHVLDNTKINTARGADIKNYNKAINHLIKKGYHIFRLGDNSMPDCKFEGVTDLAHIKHENFIDLYLIQKASLFIGTQSGPAFASHVFKIDLLATNLTEWCTSLPRKKGNFFINKVFFNKLNNKRVSISEILQKDFNFQVHVDKIDERDILLQDNSESEILDALKDYFNFQEENKNYTPEQLIYIDEHNKWLNKTLVNNKDLKIHYAPKGHYDYLRMKSIACSSVSSTIAQSFLKKYWD